METVTDLHREGSIELLIVNDGRGQVYRVAFAVDSDGDGVKIPLHNGVEDRVNTTLISRDEIRRLRSLYGKSDG